MWEKKHIFCEPITTSVSQLRCYHFEFKQKPSYIRTNKKNENRGIYLLIIILILLDVSLHWWPFESDSTQLLLFLSDYTREVMEKLMHYNFA